MSGVAHKSLHIPPWQIPYLEKHRIFELFHELARELVIQQPEDHVSFLKQILLNSVRSRDVSRVIILHSPKVNCIEIANTIAAVTNQIVLTEESLTAYAKASRLTNPNVKAKLIAQIVRRDKAYKNGWILVDCIKHRKDANALVQIGILPTHVIQFIPPFHPPLTELQYCHVPTEWPEYRKTILELRDVYKNVLMEVYMKQHTLYEVAAECIELLKIKPAKYAMQPRILILGPRGSGRKTQARMLAAELHLIHIDFERLICEMWMSESDLGARLRSCKNEACLHSELLAEVIHKRVLEADCLENGWVLTGFPFSKRDFEYLDCIYTPPNRVIFLECDLSLCKERLLNRKINIYTGSVTNITEQATYDESVLKSHIKDNKKLIDAEISYYCENYGEIKVYCGDTAHYINGNQDVRWIFETIKAIINRAPNPAAPRKPFYQKTPSYTSLDGCCCSPVPSQVMDCYNAKL